MRWGVLCLIVGCDSPKAVSFDLADDDLAMSNQDLSLSTADGPEVSDLALVFPPGSDLYGIDFAVPPDLTRLPDLYGIDLLGVDFSQTPMDMTTPTCGTLGLPCCSNTTCNSGLTCMFQTDICATTSTRCEVPVSCGGFNFSCCDANGAATASVGGYCHDPYRCIGNKCTKACP